MSKRAFRMQPAEAPRYPTAAQASQDRREFLALLGAGLLGAVVTVDIPDDLGNNGRRPPKGKKKGKAKTKKKPKKKKHARKKPPIKQPRVFLGLSSGPNAPVDM